MVQPTPRPDWPAVLIVDRPGDVIHLASTFLSGTELYSCGLDGKHHGILFTERELSICYRPSVCRLLTFVRPTQAVQIFGNISTALSTLAIR